MSIPLMMGRAAWGGRLSRLISGLSSTSRVFSQPVHCSRTTSSDMGMIILHVQIK